MLVDAFDAFFGTWKLKELGVSTGAMLAKAFFHSICLARLGCPAGRDGFGSLFHTWKVTVGLHRVPKVVSRHKNSRRLMHL